MRAVNLCFTSRNSKVEPESVVLIIRKVRSSLLSRKVLRRQFLILRVVSTPYDNHIISSIKRLNRIDLLRMSDMGKMT